MVERRRLSISDRTSSNAIMGSRFVNSETRDASASRRERAAVRAWPREA